MNTKLKTIQVTKKQVAALERARKEFGQEADTVVLILVASKQAAQHPYLKALRSLSVAETALLIAGLYEVKKVIGEV